MCFGRLPGSLRGMALSVTPRGQLGSTIVVQTDTTGTVDANVLATSGTLIMIDVDNTLNPAQAVYLKFWDAVAPTIGTDAPDMIIPIKAGLRRQIAIPEGWAFSALSFACVTEAAVTGTTSPTNDVVTRMVTT